MSVVRKNPALFSGHREVDVPLIDLAPQYQAIAEQLHATVDQLARAGSFTLGAELDAFEREFATFCGVHHCVGVANGTDALRIALHAVGVAPGGEVLTVPNSFVATTEAIHLAGARPRFVDIDPDTRSMDPDRLRKSITPNTAAVVPVHLFGCPAPMPQILAVCEEAGVPVIEDAAQAHGATVGGRRVGACGAAGAFSFYPTKNLGAMGDAGAIVCDDPAIARIARSLRHHGSEPGNANHHVRIGTTARLDNLQAAILRLKLVHLERWNEQRRRAAARYRELLADLPIRLPVGVPVDGRQVFHLFVIGVHDRDRVLAALRSEGIGAGVHYPTPTHLQPAWRWLGYPEGSLPVAEAAAHEALSLPLFPGITDVQLERVSDALHRVLRTDEPSSAVSTAARKRGT